MDNLYIKETWINQTENYCIGDSEYYETFTDNKGVLFNSLQKEWGRCISKMMIDLNKGGSKQIGWVFEKIDCYEDTHEKFIRHTWVELSATEPKKVCTLENVTNAF